MLQQVFCSSYFKYNSCSVLPFPSCICIHGQVGDGLVLSVLPAAQAGGSRVPPVPGQGAARYARHCCNPSIKMSQICQISLLPLPTKDQPPPRRHLTQAFSCTVHPANNTKRRNGGNLWNLVRYRWASYGCSRSPSIVFLPSKISLDVRRWTMPRRWKTCCQMSPPVNLDPVN